MRLFTLLTAGLMLCCSAAFGQLVINEMMSGNATTLPDAEGDFPDWLELFNHTGTVIDLTGYYLSDDASNPQMWEMPSMTLVPGEFLVIFASGKDTVIGNEWHTNFKISLEGETVYLINSSGGLVDEMTSEPLWSDVSFGRLGDAGASLSILDIPSPGSTNTASATISFSHQRGFYNGAFDLTMTTSNPWDTLYYTLDGSYPGPGDSVFATPLEITTRENAPNVYSNIQTGVLQNDDNIKGWRIPAEQIEKTTVVRCIAYRNGVPVSRVHTHTYFVGPNVNNRYKYPVVSLTTDPANLFDSTTGIYVPGIHFDASNPDWTGNYYQRGIAWERPVHIEYFEEDGTLGFHQQSGMRIHGGKTRANAQKSIRLYARSEYGLSHFDHPIFATEDEKPHKRLLLRTSSGSWTDEIFKDELMQFSASTLDMETQNYRACIVFLDGEYWGIHTIRELQDNHYLAAKFDLNPDSIDIVNGNLTVEQGSNADFIDLLEYVEENDMADLEHYNYVADRIDIKNFIDYHIVQLYVSNSDWPQNNMRMWRDQRSGGKWRWILYDLDAGAASPWIPSLERLLDDEDLEYFYVRLIRKLLDNPNFRGQFISRTAYHLGNTFDSGVMTARVENFKSTYQPDLLNHIDRWHYPKSPDHWQYAINKLHYYVRHRPCHLRYQLMVYYDLNEFDFDCVPVTDDDNLVIYPNPSNGRFSIHDPVKTRFDGTVVITNMMGEVVYTEELEDITTVVNFNLTDIDALTPGVYILTLYEPWRTLSSKLVIQY